NMRPPRSRAGHSAETPLCDRAKRREAVRVGAVEPTTDDLPFQVASSRFNWIMFLMGAGFMLIETKTLAKTALLAGATWVVNTFLIAAVLLMILAANLVVMRGWLQDVRLGLSALFASILLDWIFRFNAITFVQSPAWNLAIVLTLMALPLFFAGILFANFYKNAENPGAALGYNLFGAMAGGILEYTSMAWGVNNLNLVSLIAYGGVALFVYRKSRASILMPANRVPSVTATN